MKPRQIATAASLALIASAVEDQLKRPPAERTWYGRLGPVPYDLRPPTLQRIRQRMWDADNPSFFAPMVFGVGWTVNLYRCLHPSK